MTRNIKEASPPLGICFMLLGAIAVTASFVWLLIDLPRSGDSSSWTIAAEKGDFIGGHLSLAASVGGNCFLVAALLFQRKELQLQRHDLALHHEEFEQIRVANQEQAEVAKLHAKAAAYAFLVESINRIVSSRIEVCGSVSVYAIIIDAMKLEIYRNDRTLSDLHEGKFNVSDVAAKLFENSAAPIFNYGEIAAIVRMFAANQAMAISMIESSDIDRTQRRHMYRILGNICGPGSAGSLPI